MIRVRRALFSAYNKDGLLPLAKEAARWGAGIVSSGGTAAYLKNAGLEVIPVEVITGTGPLFGGRVKTLHPKIHGGILYRRDLEEDREAAAAAGIEGIDLVVVNLYPFREALGRDVSHEELVELIDIGGPAMVRAAAKNHRHVAVVTRPEEYGFVRDALERGEGSLDDCLLRELAATAFQVTSAYDAAVAGYLYPSGPLPAYWAAAAPLRLHLRYGENPLQHGGLYGEGGAFPFNMEHLHGRELSYNNLLDLCCGRDVASEFGGDRVAVVVKHGIPCGTATGNSLADAYRRARDADSLSAFGGVVVLKETVDEEAAAALNESFIEAVLAPGYEPGALAMLRKRKKRAILRCPAPDLECPSAGMRGRFAASGFLLQTPMPAGAGDTGWTVVTARAPDARETDDLRFAWRVLKHVRSNGILIARDGCTIGVGSGQCSRVDSVELAIRKARREGHQLHGSVLVSDAFFPFRDSIDMAAEAGVTAILQPGGSVRDEESIQACDEHGMAMACNGVRVFSHG